MILAADFFHVDTVFLRACTCRFFIEHGTRRVQLAGITGERVTQQARNLLTRVGPRFTLERSCGAMTCGFAGCDC